MKKLALGLFGVLILVLAGLKLFETQIAWSLFNRTVDRAMDRNVVAELGEGLHVGLCGSGGPFPNTERGAACIFVLAGDQFFVFDAGSRAAGNLGAMGLPVGDITGIFLTHFHSDHIDGLGELMMNRWVGAGNPVPVPVYGPEGVARVVDGINMAYAQDATYRTAHHGNTVAPPSGTGGTPITFEVPDDPLKARVVLETADLKVSAFPVDHEPVHPSVGYRIDYKGRSVVISGDTSANQSVLVHARDADVLVHEVLNREMIRTIQKRATEKGLGLRAKIMADIQTYHTSPDEAADIAERAGVKTLLFYHIVPPVPPRLEKIYLGRARDKFSGTMILGEDGTTLSLPPKGTEDGDKVIRSALLR